MHLVTDETAVQSSTLRARNPVMQGLKNCLRTAARHDIHNVTVPLLLVHSMLPVCVMCGMCVWCVYVCDRCNVETVSSDHSTGDDNQLVSKAI